MTEEAVSYGGNPFNESLIESHTLTPAPQISQSDLGVKASGEEAVTYKFDPNYTGDVEDRSCTDVCMLVFFILYFCGMLALFIFALTKSFVSYLYLPTDYRGFICGYKNNELEVNISGANHSLDYSNKELLFWYRPGNKGFVRSVCVETCPTEGKFLDSYLKVAENQTYSQDYPVYTADSKVINASLQDPYINRVDNYVPTYSSTPVMKRCFPTEIIDNIFVNQSNYTEQLKSFSEDMSTAVTAITDISNTWWTIIVLSLSALVFSALWIIALKWSAGFFVWATVLFAFCGLAFLTYQCHVQTQVQNSKVEVYTFGLLDSETNRSAFRILFWVLIVIDVIVLLIFLFACSRIQLTIGIIKFVATVFGHVPSLFIFPIIPFVLMILWWSYCIGVAVVLFGAGNFVYNDNADNMFSIGTLGFNYDLTIQYMSIYHFVGMLWGTAFITSLAEITICGVFAKYFFSREPREESLGDYPVLGSMKRALKYHTGSIAFGSLLITICQIIRIMLEYFDEKTKNSQNQFVKYLVKCMRCCLYCFEKFIRYISRNAYVLIASHGYSFFKGACEAFNLIIRNPVRAATVDYVGDFTLFLGRILVSSVVCALSLIWFSSLEDVTFYIVPAIVVLLLSFIISGEFTSLFEMGIDASLLCALEDEERNDNTPGHERYAPQELLEIMNKSK